MDEKETIIKKPKFWVHEVKTIWGTSTVFTNYDLLSPYYNLWDLADSILAAGEITNELFKRIGEVLMKKELFWESIGVKNECP